MSGTSYDFRYAPVLRDAALSDATVRIVQGPVESGKTVWSCLMLYREMCRIPRCRDGVRRSRWLVQRTTEAELIRGIMRTWSDMFPEEIYGAPEGSMPAIHRLRFLDVEAEVEFFAFEDASEKVLKKLRSTEYTGALINEGQFVDLPLVLAIQQRCGRYPRAIDCPDFDRKRRVFMDMNAPRTPDHWVLYMRGDVPMPADFSAAERRKYRKPATWEFFTQPPAVRPIFDAQGDIERFELHPDIENLPYQDEAAILGQCETGDIDDIRRDYMNEVVIARSGKPRYPQFRRDWHVAKERLKPAEGVPPVIGWDPGLSGAAVFLQKVNGQWRGFREMIARNNPDLNSAEKQGLYMLEVLRTDFPWYQQTGVACWGDPFGSWGGVSAEETRFKIVEQLGLVFQQPAPRDNPALRHEIGTTIVRRGELGVPGLLLCPVGCPRLIDSFDGGAKMKVTKREGQMVMEEKLIKDGHADVIEAAEYAFWGGGEDHRLVERPVTEKPPSGMNTLGSAPVLSRGKRGRKWLRRAG